MSRSCLPLQSEGRQIILQRQSHSANTAIKYLPAYNRPVTRQIKLWTTLEHAYQILLRAKHTITQNNKSWLILWSETGKELMIRTIYQTNLISQLALACVRVSLLLSIGKPNKVFMICVYVCELYIYLQHYITYY